MKYYKESDIRGAKFNTISNPYSQGWNDGIDSILENATPSEITDMNPAPETISEGGHDHMKYEKRTARELKDAADFRINGLRKEMARIDGQLKAWLEIREELSRQIIAERQEQEEPEA